LRQLYKDSGGIPRLINVVADRALLAAYTQEQSEIDSRLVKNASREVFGKRRGPLWPWAAVVLGIGALVLATGTLRDPPATGPAAVGAAPAESLTVEPSATAAALVEEELPAEVSATEVTPLDAGTPEAQPEEPTALAALLADSTFASDATTVLHELFGLWQAVYDPAGGAPCAQALDQHLQCLTLDHGSIGELRKINRPAMLTLVDDARQRRFVLVTQLDYEGATLTSQGKTAHIGIAELTRYWYGENLVLWKPIFADSPLVPGSRSESVLWLRDSIQQVFGLTLASADPLHYDDALVEKVREFQRREQLKIDGIVGVETQISLQAALGAPDVPLLSERR
jgi:general secretion pathway protein A